MKKEIWKDIPGYESFYQSSNFGRIKRLASDFKDSEGKTYRRNFERILAQPENTSGYKTVTLHKDGIGIDKSVHYLIAICFIGEKPFEKAEINHIDYNKHNNSPGNLQWVSHGDNMRHAFKSDKNIQRTAYDFGNRTRVMNRKLSLEQVHEIRQLFSSLKDKQIAEKYGVNRKTISLIRRGINWVGI